MPTTSCAVEDRELTLLNFYRASELHGGLILAQVARRTRDAHVASRLLAHGAEELVHAQLWNDTIIAVGGAVRPVRDTYQTRFAAVLGAPTSLVHVLALTQVFERRVYRHFLDHHRRPGTHPSARATLRRMLRDERAHLSWVKEWLDRQQTTNLEIPMLMRQYTELDARVYRELTVEFEWSKAA